MSDTFITVIAIGLAAILMFIVPLMTTADRADDVSQLAVQAATSDFVDKVRTTGKITQTNYSKLLETVTATGNTYGVEMTVQVKDMNLGKKTSLAQNDKIGENAYYSIYTSQIEEKMNADGAYYCKEGDIVTVSVKNTSQTIAQQLKNAFYAVTGNDAYTIAAQQTGIVTVNGK